VRRQLHRRLHAVQDRRHVHGDMRQSRGERVSRKEVGSGEYGVADDRAGRLNSLGRKLRRMLLLQDTESRTPEMGAKEIQP
jgi:hypothetical protein